MEEKLIPYAKKYIWFQKPEEAVKYPRRVIAQVMNFGEYDDVLSLSELVGDDALKDVIKNAEAGWFNKQSWNFWHYKLGLAEIDQVPPLPKRFELTVNTIPVPLMSEKALLMLESETTNIIYHTLSLFEHNSATLEQSKLVILGHEVPELTTHETGQILRLQAGIKTLVNIVSDYEFDLSINTAMRLHKVIGYNEALEWGMLRKHQVHIGRSHYIPPNPFELPILAQDMARDLNKIEDVTLRACMTFLKYAKTQFFYDCNKRTALLMMMGELARHGYPPLFFLLENRDVAVSGILKYYEDNNPFEVIKLLTQTSVKLYENKNTSKRP